MEGQQHAEESISDEELVQLLERLEGVHAHLDLHPMPEHQITLRDVRELTEIDVERLFNELVAMRREQQAEELTVRLRELEEPTYRVERPGTAPVDPLARLHPMTYFKAVPTILDKMTRPPELKVHVKRLDSEAEARTAKQGTIVLTVLAVVFVLFLVLYLVSHRI